MSELFRFNSQSWRLWSSEGLNLFLPRNANPDRVYFHCEWTFVPPDVKDDDLSDTDPRFYLMIMGCVPDLHDWRDLAGRTLGGADDGDENLDSYDGGPDLSAYPPGADPKARADGWDTRFTFGTRDDYEFEFELEAFRPSERAYAAQRELAVKRIMGEKLPPDWEGRDWLNEGDTLSFSGRIRFSEILCQVPINSRQPINWAKDLARDELLLHEFGFCRVNGGDWFNGKFKPADGIGNEGRLVILNTVTDFFHEWQENHPQPPPE